ncbi:MAG: sodium:proton antiporter [Acidobacteriota bacterium]|nr:sodium:proton antiporter [Acidobacteriota bacterium]
MSLRRLSRLFLVSVLVLLVCGAAGLALGQESSHTGPPAHSQEAAALHGGAEHASAQSEHLGAELALWWVVPFAGILLSIAVFPLLATAFWHHHYPKVAAFWALLLAIPFLVAYGHEALHAIVHIYLIDYIPFIILLWGLFTVAGGIVVRGSLRGRPAVNTTMLAIGTLIASWVGTTGAAMVMIRPVLRANASRRHKVHTVIFFIFLVANIGGSLTPLGDPPLFLGFLHSVPFFWTFKLALPMAVVSVLLLATYFAIDTVLARKEDPATLEHSGERRKFAIAGAHNFLFLAGIVGLVLMSGVWKPGHLSVMGIEVGLQNLARDVGIIVMGLLSLWTTRRELRRENEFSWEPILEVAYLFAGIFMTIIPALEILKAGEHGALAGLIRSVNEPWHYFWITGGLSSFLDNAPTYLTFFNTALGKFYPGVVEAEAVRQLIANNEIFLEAIASGAVFMGACTYIGNAPNFMVKSIAEQAGIQMPSFFGYIFRWTLPILIPTFLVVTFLFFL